MNRARPQLARLGAATIVVLFASAACGGSGSESETGQITQPAEASPLACNEASGVITTVAGRGEEGEDDIPGYHATGDGGPATEALLDRPGDLGMDAAGNLYILEDASHPPQDHAGRVRRVDPSGRITTVVGPPTSGGQPHGEASRLELTAEGEARGIPSGIDVDPDGNIFVTAGLSAEIFKIDPSGNVSTVAGTGEAGFSGDGGPAT
jgi:hypothetical protein